MTSNWFPNQRVLLRFVNLRGVLYGLLIGLLGLTWGCNKQLAGPDPQSTKKKSTREDLDEALNYIGSLDDFDQEQVIDLTVYYLNRWIAPKSTDDQWSRSSLIDALPLRLRDMSFVGTVEDKKFSYIDVTHIHQCVWLRHLSDWISRRTDVVHLQSWPQVIPDSLAPQERQKLLLAGKLFDWTIRNVQLDELAESSQEKLDQSWNRAFEGAPGPGYTQAPEEAVLYGHGDAWQRARLFILLARQQRIDILMLAIQRTPDGQPVPWLPAVMVNDQLYLFDTQLGLPLLNPETGQIASLQDVDKNPKIFSQLSTQENQPYRVGPEDSSRITALIDASPFALSQRMLMLQKQLTGTQQMILTVSPDKIGKQLRDKHGIDSTRLWNVPFETLLYRYDGRKNIATSADPSSAPLATRYPMENELFRPELRNPLILARQRYIRGQFENLVAEKGQSATPGAKPLLMSARRSEKEIEGIKTISGLQEALQLQQQPEETNAAWQQRLDTAQRFYRANKQYASYRLGLIHLEEGHYQVAISWLQRALSDGEENPFFQGAHYNLGRCYEALGNSEKANEMYQFADSPQFVGNQLRSKQLAKEKGNEPRETSRDPVP